MAKPCPFCGSADVKAQDSAYEWGDTAPGFWQAHCDECGADGPTADTPKEAMELWDQRATKEG